MRLFGRLLLIARDLIIHDQLAMISVFTQMFYSAFLFLFTSDLHLISAYSLKCLAFWLFSCPGKEKRQMLAISLFSSEVLRANLCILAL